VFSISEHSKSCFRNPSGNSAGIFYALYRGVGENSMGLYFRTMRAVYNKAVADGVAKKRILPFLISKFQHLKQKTKNEQ
jgi:Phage integrase SAM-like domain